MSGEGNFTTTEKDLVAANRLHARQLWNRRAILRGWIFTTVALALILFAFCRRFDWTILLAPLAATAFMGVGAAFANQTFAIAARRHYRQARAFWQQTTIEWDDGSVRFVSDRGNVRFNWADFYSWAADDQSILLYQSANSFITVPTRELGENARLEIVSALTKTGVTSRSSR